MPRWRYILVHTIVFTLELDPALEIEGRRTSYYRFPEFHALLPFRFYMGSTLYVFLPVGVCLPCDHGLDFDIMLRENSINQSVLSLKVVRNTVFDCCGNCFFRGLELVDVNPSQEARWHRRS